VSAPEFVWSSFGAVARWVGRSGKRVGVALLGGTLLAGGVALLVLPGPGLLLIIAGLAVLATEFAWAQVALEKAREKALQAKEAAKSGAGRFRRRS
jgi:hypothetical protein